MSERDSICASEENPVLGLATDTKHEKAKCYERLLVKHVYSGKWRLTSDGHVWAASDRHLPERRIDRPTNRGYRKVQGRVGGRQICCMVHRLVWQASFGDIPHWAVVNHKNGNRTDNRLDNLEICTEGHNSRHAIESGLTRIVLGSATSSAKLTERDVSGIRKLFRANVPCPLIARLFGVSIKTVYGLKYEGRWPHVQ